MNKFKKCENLLDKDIFVPETKSQIPKTQRTLLKVLVSMLLIGGGSYLLNQQHSSNLKGLVSLADVRFKSAILPDDYNTTEVSLTISQSELKEVIDNAGKSEKKAEGIAKELKETEEKAEKLAEEMRQAQLKAKQLTQDLLKAQEDTKKYQEEMKTFLEGEVNSSSAWKQILSAIQKINPSARSVTPLYSSRNDGWNRLTLYEKTFGYQQSVVLVKTNYDKIVGAYMPDQWGQAEYREVSNGKTLQFFFAGDEIKVCTLKDGQTEHYYSSSDWLLFFNGGLAINANRAQHDYASISKSAYSCPDHLDYAQETQTSFLTSGNDYPYFNAYELEVWGVLNN